MSTTVSLLATEVVAEGGTITYTASLGAIPALSDVTVALDNGQTITIAAGQTSGAVTVAAPADVYADTPGALVAAIASVTGTGGFDSLVFDPTVVSTAVSQVTDVTTVSLSATAAVAEGGTITYTASVGANPALSDVTVTLDNGQTITIAAGQTSGSVTVAAAADAYAATPGAQLAAIASVTGTGGFESLVFDPAAVSTTVIDVIDVTTVSLAATAVVAEGGTITYTASVGANPALSDVTVALDNGQTITIAAGQTSGAVTVAAPADVYAGTPGAQLAAIASVTGTGGFESLTFDPAAVSITVADVIDVTTVSLAATAVVAEGGTITYTASVGANPALSDVTVALDNGQTITIAAGQTSGAVTVAAPADVYAGTPGAQLAAIASVTGTGGFESLTFDPAAVSITVADVIDVTTVSLAATAVVAEGGAITYTASVGANPALSDVTVTLDNGQTITIAAGQTSGAVTVAAPADVYAGTPGAQLAAIASVTGTGGFESLTFDPAAVSITVADVIDVTTVSLAATAVVAEGGTITYTASVGANPALSDVTVALDNGQTITIAAGQTSGAVTVAAPADVYAGTPSAQLAAIASVTGTGGFESLTFDPAAVSITVADVIDVTTVSLAATAVVAEGGAITYTASVGANPALSDVTVTLDNGQTITIAAGQTSGAVTVVPPADVFAGTPTAQVAAVASLTGTGGFESLSFNPVQVSTAILSSAVVAVNETDAPISTGGLLTISNLNSPGTFVAQTDVAGANGHFSIDSAGAWAYTANSAFDNLNVGQSVSDTFAVASADGTQTSVQVTINGTNDAAVLSSATMALTETNAALTTDGALTIADVDSPATFVAQTTAAAHGTFSIDTAGAWTYTANSAFDSLNVGESVSDTFSVASADGTTTSVQVTINGTNDAAVLSSAVVALDETNAALTTGGTLTISDVDSPATLVAQTDVAGANGHFSIDTTGAWTYTANSAFDALNVGQSVSDTFAVASADGTQTSVQVTINGTNDAAVLSSAVVALDETNAALTTGGTLTISDVDSPATFVAQTEVAGANGHFSIDSAGAWTYTANSAFDNLNVGQSVSDTFTVASADGTQTSVQVTINGTNDAAVLSSATMALTETNAPLTTGGTLTITDVDSPATFIAQTTAAAHGTFSIDTAGVWTYTANSAFDSLNVGESVSDTFSVASADGTTTSVQVTINGTNDTPIVTAVTAPATILDTAITNSFAALTGSISATDVDTGDTLTYGATGATVTAGAATMVGTYGTLSINTATGGYTYTVNAAAVNALNVGQNVADTFSVTATDSHAAQATQALVFNVTGANDAAVIAGVSTGAVTEAGLALGVITPGTPTVSGLLTDSDVDNPANTFTPVTAPTASTGGFGTFTMTTGGAWTYTLDNLNPIVNALNAGQTQTDTFTVTTADGTPQVVTVTINGATDQYNLTDTAANLANPAITPTALGNGATNIIVTTPATVAQAAVIDAFTNVGTNSYSLLDTAANLAVNQTTPGSVAATVFSGATNITASTGATILQAEAIDAFTNSGTRQFSISEDRFGIFALNSPLGVATANHAINFTMVDPVVTASGAVIAKLTNSGTRTYDISDTVGNLLLHTLDTDLSANHARNISTIAAFGGTMATVAQAAQIDAFTNSGTNTYDISDTAANLSAALSSTLFGAHGIVVNGFGTVAQIADIQARAVNVVVPLDGVLVSGGGFFNFTLGDTAANLALAPAIVGNRAIAITATTPATVTQAAAIQAFVPLPGQGAQAHQYDISDTAAALAAAPALVGNGAQNITATGITTVAQATIIDAFTNAGINSYALTDTAANLAAATASVGSGASVLTATTAATVAQAAVFTAFVDSFVPGGGVKNYSLADTAAALAAATPLVGNGAINITATTAATVAQANAIDAFTNTGANSYVLSDSAANLAAATALVGHNATNIVATTAATVAQAVAIDAFTNSGTNSFSLADTAANLVAALPAVANQATNITVTGAATVAQANTIDAFLNPGANSYALADSSVNLLAALPARLSLATQVTATNPISVANAVSLRTLNANTVYSLSDNAASLAAAGPAVGNAATGITVTGSATVAQAVTIEGYTNAGALSFVLSDSAASLAAASAAVLGAATSIVVTDGVTVAAATTLHAANANATYGLSDTPAALAALTAASGVGQKAILINSTAPVTMAQIDAIHAYKGPTAMTLLGVSDSAASIAGKVALNDVALADARSFIVNTAATVLQADAIHGFNATSAKATYAISDTAANLAAAIAPPLGAPADPALASATAFTVTGAAATVAQANLIHGYDAVSSLATYLLADTAAALVAAPAATVHSATDVTVSDFLNAAQASTLSAELGVPADPAHFHYSLTDSAANLAALPAGLVTGHTVSVVGPATVAQATTIHAEVPLTAYSIVDDAATLALGLTTGNASLGAVKFAGTIDVLGPTINASLTLNADEMHNMLLAGHPLLALNDTIALDGDNPLTPVNLGTLSDFGGNDGAGIVLGGPTGSSYIVNLGTSGDLTATMAGTGHHDITGATGTGETFVVGLTSTGGSTLRNLESREIIDISAGNLGQGTKNSPSTQVATGSAVIAANQWAYEATNHTLTWWDQTHNTPETLVLHFAAVGDVGSITVKSTHSFQVV